MELSFEKLIWELLNIILKPNALHEKTTTLK